MKFSTQEEAQLFCDSAVTGIKRHFDVIVTFIPLRNGTLKWAPPSSLSIHDKATLNTWMDGFITAWKARK